MLAGRGHVGVDHRGNDDINIGFAREVAVFGVVVGALDVVEIGTHGDGSGQMTAEARPAGQLRRAIEGQVDFTRRTERLEAAHGHYEIVG